MPAAAGEAHVAARLAASPARPFLLACRRGGRAHVAAELRAPLMALLADLKDLDGVAGSGPVARARDLAIAFLEIEEAIGRGELNYGNYLNLPLLERFILAPDVDLVVRRSRIAFATILADWLREEEQALALADQGSPPFRFVRAQVAARIDALRDLAAFAGTAAVPLTLPTLRNWLPGGPDWIALANDADGLLGLVLLTALPQSRFHDELMFIRVTHLAECCFIPAWRALVAAQELPDAPERVLARVKEASAQVALLLKLFATTFRTLPKENFFDGFRPETGGSSAIQSRNYQILDRAIRGFGAEKVAALEGQPLVGDVPSDSTVAPGIALMLAERAAGWSAADRRQLLYHLDQVQRAFLAWRTFHLGIARDYIPAEARGTGGMGIGYLERTLNAPAATFDAPSSADDRASPGDAPVSPFAASVRIEAGAAAPPDAARKLANRLRGLGAMLSVHDPRRIAGLWWVDTANTGEFYVAAEGEPWRCREGELVVRDAKGIVASERGGAAARTCAPALSGAATELMVLAPLAGGTARPETVRAEILAALSPLGPVTTRTLALPCP
ncbi:MAG: hypothetical protein JOZ90_03235 [Alphaproteobacteria bacterium]|nr:hypothetical protein [Alphaproteobacteria bacterium]MBV9900093.1 hypothetical protein [Alphaproteobacteria bacterium]